jgi:uncharacterized protein YbjQ (UPF0145 family)
MKFRIHHAVQAGILCTASAFALAFSGAASAADKIVYFPLQKAVEAATAAGKLDGSVTFHLSGNGPSGTALQRDVVTNKKSNAFAKGDEEVCLWTAQSALISLQESAKAAGANAVTNIVSYYRKTEHKSPTDFECHVGAIMAGVALRGDLAKVK